MSECARAGCERKPTHYIKVKIAPKGFPLYRGMDVVMGLALCEEHARSITPKDIFGGDGKEQLQKALRATKGSTVVPLDFDHVQISPKPFDDEWRAFLATARGQIQ